MNIIKGFPLNYELIKLVLNPPPQAIFAWGNDLYNPSGGQIPEDILFHESIHKKQQEIPEIWWNRYLTDVQFRYEQELEAYAGQFNYIKQHYPQKAHGDALTDIAMNLKTLYSLDIDLQQAEIRIRNKAKEMSMLL